MANNSKTALRCTPENKQEEAFLTRSAVKRSIHPVGSLKGTHHREIEKLFYPRVLKQIRAVQVKSFKPFFQFIFFLKVLISL